MPSPSIHQGDKPLPPHASGYFSLKRQVRLGYALVTILFLTVFVWGSVAQISGAVLAPGRISVESSTKRIQHRDGGIVSEILVREGQKVKAGQVLLRLDATQAGASDNAVRSQLWQLMARKARLEAERDNRSDLSPPASVPDNTEFAAILTTERRLMRERLASKVQKGAQLREQIAQNENQIVGLRAQIASQTEQIRLVQQQLVGVRELHSKGYAPLSRLNELLIMVERLSGDRGQAEASIARVNNQNSELRLQLMQLDSTHLAEVMTDLKETDAKLAELRERRVSTQDVLSRVDIRAPVDGEVQQIAIHTIGGVVRPAEPLMVIVPEADDLIVEARVPPQSIDQVQVGGRAFIRFTAFNSHTTPEARGAVDTVSGDVEIDEKTGAGFYRARLRLKATDLPAEVHERLIAGMPVEVMIETSRRSVLSYILKPLSDQFNRAFREE
ncbi:HlyD family type I secretion periplasmic adaptor subunit [Asticcacaulis excentricus]|nr:HlyD family type I secretion periplasmic adaptor subunit [Asticcacaulis excentricus]